MCVWQSMSYLTDRPIHTTSVLFVEIDDRLYGLKQILTNQVRLVLPGIPLIFPFTSPIAAQYKSRIQTSVACELNVAVAVSDHPACGKVDIEICARALNQTRLGFSTVAIHPIRWFTKRRMVGAVIDGIEAG